MQNDNYFGWEIVKSPKGIVPKIVNGCVTVFVPKSRWEIIKQNQKACGFIYWYNGILQVNPQALIIWFAQNGNMFYNGNFKYFDEVLYGWNGKYWEQASELINKYTIKKLLADFGVVVPPRTIPDIVSVCKHLGIFPQHKRPSISYDKRVIVTFNNGTLEIDFANDWHTFHPGQFFKQENALYMLNHTYEDKLLNQEYWKKSFVGQYLLEYYDDAGRDTLQQFLAAILIPEFELQQGLVILGDGGDGKGVLMGAIKKLLGNVVSELKVSDWDGKHDTTALVGSILNITGEVPSREILLDTWKSIIACDWMEMNPKYKELFSYKPICKHIMTVNSLPQMQVDKAVVRRMPIIRTRKTTTSDDRSVFFRRDFEDDKAGLVSFMLHGLLRLHENNFRELQGEQDLTTELIYQNDSTISDFIDDCLEITEKTSDIVIGETLFRVYILWKYTHGQNSKDIIRNTFTRKIISFAKSHDKKVKSDSRKINGISVRVLVGIKIHGKWLEKYEEHSYNEES